MGGEGSSGGAAAGGAPTDDTGPLEGRSVTELGSLLVVSPVLPKLCQAKANPQGLFSSAPLEEGSIAAPSPQGLWAGVPRVLDDGPEADEWEGLVKQQDTVGELLRFF